MTLAISPSRSDSSVKLEQRFGGAVVLLAEGVDGERQARQPLDLGSRLQLLGIRQRFVETAFGDQRQHQALLQRLVFRIEGERLLVIGDGAFEIVVDLGDPRREIGAGEGADLDRSGGLRGKDGVAGHRNRQPGRRSQPDQPASTLLAASSSFLPPRPSRQIGPRPNFVPISSRRLVIKAWPFWGRRSIRPISQYVHCSQQSDQATRLMQKSMTSSSAAFCGVASSGASASRAMPPKWPARPIVSAIAPCLRHQADRLFQRRVVGLVLLDRRLPEFPLGGRAAAIGEDDRQRHLALAEIVADILAEILAGAAIVERVVDQAGRRGRDSCRRSAAPRGRCGSRRRSPARPRRRPKTARRSWP